MDNLTLYSHNDTALTADVISRLFDEPTVEEGDGALIVSWSDVTVTIHSMPGGKKLAEHLNGFQGFVRSSVGGDVEQVQDLLDMIGSVQAAYGCVIEPAFDPDNKAKSLLVSIAATLERCFMFYDGAILSPFGEVWFGPSGMPPLAELGDLTVRKTNAVPFPSGTDDQKDRYARVRTMLDTYAVPDLMKRVWVGDVSQESLRTPQEVARRVLALHAVVCIARGRPRDVTLDELTDFGADTALTPNEREFLAQHELPDDERQSMIWKLEDLWVLMWAMRHIDKFSWPNEMCDVEGLHELIFEKSKDPKRFIDQAELRSPRSILDACQLIIQLQSVIRTAHINHTLIPENLNWKEPGRQVSVDECPSIGVVAERHYALNWLRKFGEADWDDVDVPTIPSAILE